MDLVKKKLSKDWIDLSIGEAEVVREALFSTIENPKIDFNESWDYPDPCGNKDLVSFLENKHQSKVVITNGGKQALAAICYILSKNNCKMIGMRSPYWILLPPLIKDHNCSFVTTTKCNKIKYCDAFLSVTPNNPDGFLPSDLQLKEEFDFYSNEKIPYIHDAVYYNPIYMNGEFPKIGDLQIFSMSKYLGLSGLRVGYIVVNNDKYYKPLVEYMESMTSGVSVISQSYVFNILSKLEELDNKNKFESLAKSLLDCNKKQLSNINKDILDCSNISSTGMFAFVNKSNVNFEKLKINVIDGLGFGDYGKVRLNCAVNSKTILSFVERVNSSLV